jgi:hypothetical protein
MAIVAVWQFLLKTSVVLPQDSPEEADNGSPYLRSMPQSLRPIGSSNSLRQFSQLVSTCPRIICQEDDSYLRLRIKDKLAGHSESSATPLRPSGGFSWT